MSCSIFMAVPTMYVKLIEKMEGEQRELTHIRLLASGSAPLLPKDFDRIKKLFGREPVEREGMSETGMNFSNPLNGMKKPGSIGLPLPHVEVRIVNPETFQDVKPGDVGEIWLKGPNVTPGYWRKPLETEAAFIASLTGSSGLRLVTPVAIMFAATMKQPQGINFSIEGYCTRSRAPCNRF